MPGLGTLLALCLCSPFLLVIERGGSSLLGGASPWRAQAAPQQRGGGRRKSRPTLHNSRHESTVRNLLRPRFGPSPDSNPLAAGNHTRNVAVVVSSSRYWFNYRHAANALSIYQLLKRGGLMDEEIILMLADDIPCNQRNPHKGKIFPRGTGGEDLMEGAEVDYSGTDVTVDAFLRVLLGRHLPGEDGRGGRRSLPNLDSRTNVLVYLTGHGGDNFFKFQDGEELMSHDVASAFSQMRDLGLYNEILFISDTCQAFTMADEITAPGVYSVGSSLKGQNSYASHSDVDVGQSVIDRYSKIVKDFVDDAVALTSSEFPADSNEDEGAPHDAATVAVMDRLSLHDALVRVPTNHGDLGPNSRVGHSDRLCPRTMNHVRMSDFFAASPAAREAGRRGRRAELSLWMNNFLPPSEPLRGASPALGGEVGTAKEGECAARGGASLAEVGNDDGERGDRARLPLAPRGMTSTDPKFIAALVGFLSCVYLLTHVW